MEESQQIRRYEGKLEAHANALLRICNSPYLKVQEVRVQQRIDLGLGVLRSSAFEKL
jgi:hypothetical protein